MSKETLDAEISFYNRRSGYGFVTPDPGAGQEAEYFFHISAVNRFVPENFLREGALVECEIDESGKIGYLEPSSYESHPAQL